MKEYDEDDAVKFINEYVNAKLGLSIDEIQAIEIVDLTFDFFDDLSDDDDFEIEIVDNDVVRNQQMERLTNYVVRQMKKSDPGLSAELIDAIIAGELLYENSLTE